MKKYLGLGCAVVVAGFLTGCGQSTKTLSCSMEDSSSEDMKMTQTVEAKFNGDEVENIEMVSTIEVSGIYVDYVDTLQESLEEEFEIFKNKDGVTFKTENKDNVVKAIIKADLTKMDEDTKEELNMVDTSGSYEETKKQMEEEGYTCK